MATGAPPNKFGNKTTHASTPRCKEWNLKLKGRLTTTTGTMPIGRSFNTLSADYENYRFLTFNQQKFIKLVSALCHYVTEYSS